MLSTRHLVAFVLTSAALIALPGPSVLFAVSRALVLGRRGGLATVVGNAAGTYVLVVAVAAGVGGVVERSIAVFTVVKLIGGLYLVYLGVQAIRHRGSLTQSVRTRRTVADPTWAPVAGPPEAPIGSAVRQGFMVGIANPKSIVFFAAILPQFVDQSRGNVPVQLLSLGAIFLAIALVSDSAWALTAGAARDWLGRSPRRTSLIGGTGGLIMIGIGGRLLLTGQHDSP
jgi:threonine/homoserine/homoserine lactone efflux protein